MTTATVDEWLLLGIMLGCWPRVYALSARARNVYDWYCVEGNGDPVTCEDVRHYFEQEIIRMCVATMYLSGAIIGVATTPPGDGLDTLTLSARWKLWILIIAASLLWIQSERAWRSHTRRRSRGDD